MGNGTTQWMQCRTSEDSLGTPSENPQKFLIWDMRADLGFPRDSFKDSLGNPYGYPKDFPRESQSRESLGKPWPKLGIPRESMGGAMVGQDPSTGLFFALFNLFTPSIFTQQDPVQDCSLPS